MFAVNMTVAFLAVLFPYSQQLCRGRCVCCEQAMTVCSVILFFAAQVALFLYVQRVNSFVCVCVCVCMCVCVCVCVCV